MKKILLSGLFCLSMATVLRAQSQNDPGLSANNYKHPNKAAFATANNLDKRASLPLTEVKPEVSALETNGNYKGSFYVAPQNAVTVTAPDKGQLSRSGGNYKAQSNNISKF